MVSAILREGKSSTSCHARSEEAGTSDEEAMMRV